MDLACIDPNKIERILGFNEAQDKEVATPAAVPDVVPQATSTTANVTAATAPSDGL